MLDDKQSLALLGSETVKVTHEGSSGVSVKTGEWLVEKQQA